MRFGLMQACPVLRNLTSEAPFAACFGLASAKTRKGAWPPSSSEMRFICAAAPWASILPTSVEPVKVSLRTAGLARNSSPIGVGIERGDEIGDARRDAGVVQHPEDRDRAKRRRLGRLEHDGAARGQRRRDLARDHRDRIVPGRDRADHADRLAQHQEALVAARRGDRLAVDALRFLRVPQQEVGAVLHLVARGAQRLALLGGHDARRGPPCAPS